MSCVAKHEYRCRQICGDFIEVLKRTHPEMMRKPKVHLFLHLVDNQLDFGPTSAYNTERLISQNVPLCTLYYTCRCEAFNSLVRASNVFSSRQAPSRDIANRFAKLEHLRLVMDGGSLDDKERLVVLSMLPLTTHVFSKLFGWYLVQKGLNSSSSVHLL